MNRIIYAVWLAAFSAIATDVQFQLTDARLSIQTTTNRIVWIYPMSTPTATSPSVIIGGRMIYLTDSSGQFVVSNLFTGLYSCSVQAPPQQVNFKILVTAPNLGLIEAADNLVADSTATFPAGSVAWAATVTDARYSRIGQGGSVNALTNQSSVGWTNSATEGVAIKTGTSNTFQVSAVIGSTAWRSNGVDVAAINGITGSAIFARGNSGISPDGTIRTLGGLMARGGVTNLGYFYQTNQGGTPQVVFDNSGIQFNNTNGDALLFTSSTNITQLCVNGVVMIGGDYDADITTIRSPKDTATVEMKAGTLTLRKGAFVGNGAFVTNSPRSSLTVTGEIVSVAATAITSPMLITNNNFEVVARFRRVTPIDPQFILADWTFQTSDALGWAGASGVGNPVSSDFVDGAWTPSTHPLIADTPKLKLCEGALVFELSGLPANNFYFGFHTGTTNQFIAVWDDGSGTLTYPYMLGNWNIGSHTMGFAMNQSFPASASNVPAMTAPCSVAFTFNDNSMALWWKTANGVWTVGCRQTNNLHNWRLPRGVGALRPAFDYSGSGLKITRIYAGYPGDTGIANASFLRYDDGSPIQRDGKLFFIASGALVNGDATGSLANAARSTPCNVYSFDPHTIDLKTVCKINTVRTNELRCENSGCGIFNRQDGFWYWVIPNWSNAEGLGGSSSPIRLFCYRTISDPFNCRELVLTNGVDLSPPAWTSNTSQYDPDLLYISNKWQLAFTQADIDAGNDGPALATADNIMGPYTLVSYASNYTGHVEGTKLQCIGGTWCVLAGNTDGSGGAVDEVYDLNMLRRGTNKLGFALQGGIYSHPNSVMLVENGAETWYHLGFNNVVYTGSGGLGFGDLIWVKCLASQPFRTFNAYQPRW